jgi:acetate kinase
MKNSILTINGGSSSIKFALYEEESLKELLNGEIESVGSGNSKFTYTSSTNNQKKCFDLNAADYNAAINFLIDWLQKQEEFRAIESIGHRIVHGMEHTKPTIINEELLSELKQISAYDPEHLPNEIKLIEVFQEKFPALVQIACFDTSFHITMPNVAKQIAIPRKYSKKGIQRYGFHGLSYSYLMEELKSVGGNETAQGKIILAHIGNGASLAAVKDGHCIDTSMGFTPSSGLVMGTRSGDLDPGVAWYLIDVEKMSAKEFNHLINHESGLLGVSQTSSDMRDLLKHEKTDHRAAEAIELFCYQTKKWIGAYAATLGGLDTLIFSAGIGENAPEVRRRICNGLQFLGIELDEALNQNNEAIISNNSSKVSVRVIKTNEELMIARSVCEALNNSIEN